MNGKIRVLAAAPADSMDSIGELLDCEEIDCIQTIPINTVLAGEAASLPYDVSVLYCEVPDEVSCSCLQTLYMARKDTLSLLICDDCGRETLEKAMQCGVTRVIPADTPPDDICACICREYEKFSARAAAAAVRRYESRVIGFYSSKGGAGKTLCAVNTAALLARSGLRTVIVDADLQFGDVSACLDVQCGSTLFELSGEKNVTPGAVKKCIVSSSCGVDVLAAPQRPEQASSVTAQCIRSVISSLRSGYDYVIADLPSALDSFTLTVLGQCDTLYFVVNPEVPSLKSARVCLSGLEKYSLPAEPRLILNRAGKSSITASDVRTVSGIAPCACIPLCPAEATDSVNSGVPAVIRAGGRCLYRSFSAFVSEEFGIKQHGSPASARVRWTGRR